MKSDSFIFSL